MRRHWHWRMLFKVQFLLDDCVVKTDSIAAKVWSLRPGLQALVDALVVDLGKKVRKCK